MPPGTSRVSIFECWNLFKNDDKHRDYYQYHGIVMLTSEVVLIHPLEAIHKSLMSVYDLVWISRDHFILTVAQMHYRVEIAAAEEYRPSIWIIPSLLLLSLSVIVGMRQAAGIPPCQIRIPSPAHWRVGVSIGKDWKRCREESNSIYSIKQVAACKVLFNSVDAVHLST